MKPHLLTDSGKIYVVELPDKPDPKTAIFIADKQEKYRTQLKQALSNKIEVHPDCVDEAIEIICKTYRQSPFDNHPYLIEGLKVETEDQCECDWVDPQCLNPKCPKKRYAIISI